MWKFINALKKGLLNVNEDDSFLVSSLKEGILDSGIIGGILGELIEDALFGGD